MARVGAMTGLPACHALLTGGHHNCNGCSPGAVHLHLLPVLLQHPADRGSPCQQPPAEGGCPCQLSSCGTASLEAAARPRCSLLGALWHLTAWRYCLLSLHACRQLTARSSSWLGGWPPRLLSFCLHPTPSPGSPAGAVQELTPPTAEQRAAFLRPVVERLPQPPAPVGLRKRKAPPAQVRPWCARCDFMQVQLLVRGL